MNLKTYKIKEKYALDSARDLLRCFGIRATEQAGKKLCFLIKEEFLDLK